MYLLFGPVAIYSSPFLFCTIAIEWDLQLFHQIILIMNYSKKLSVNSHRPTNSFFVHVSFYFRVGVRPLRILLFHLEFYRITVVYV